jgi:hypothetical protein
MKYAATVLVFRPISPKGVCAYTPSRGVLARGGDYGVIWMIWEEVKEAYPSSWLVIEAIEAKTEEKTGSFSNWLY